MILKDMTCFIKKITNKIYIPRSLRQATKNTMNTNFIRDRKEQNRISGITLNCLFLYKILNIVCLYSFCKVCQMKCKECKKYGLLLPKIAESDNVSLGRGLCGSGSPFTIRTQYKIHCLHALIMIDPLAHHHLV
jgi:hypothetical protein